LADWEDLEGEAVLAVEEEEGSAAAEAVLEGAVHPGAGNIII
jgi:hypothetical protein